MFFNFADKVLFPVGTLENHGIVGVVFFAVATNRKLLAHCQQG